MPDAFPDFYSPADRVVENVLYAYSMWLNEIDADPGAVIIAHSCFVSKANRDLGDHSLHAVKCVETRTPLIKLFDTVMGCCT